MIEQLKTYVKRKKVQNIFLYKLILSLFICGIIISIIGIKSGQSDMDLYMFCLITSSVSFYLGFMLFPLNEKKREQIFYKIGIYVMMSIITVLVISTSEWRIASETGCLIFDTVCQISSETVGLPS